MTGRFLSPSSWCPRIFHPAFILGPPRSSLDVHWQPWQTHALLPIILPLCLPALPGRKKLATYCMSAAEALSSPPSSIVCTTTSLHKHSWTHTLSHTHAERNTSGEPRKIWVAQQEQGVRNYSDWCSVLTFTENGWEIMEKCDIQSGNITAAAWCLLWSRIKETGLMTLHSKAQVWLEFIEQQQLQYH